MNSEYNKNPLPDENGTGQFALTAESIVRADRTADGIYAFDMSAGNVTIDDSSSLVTNNAVYGAWMATGLTANRELIAPARAWRRYIINNSAFSVKVVLVAAGDGETILAGETRLVFCDGTTVFRPTVDGALTPASQAEAEAGTENTKFMTALRVAHAIAALAPTGGGGGGSGDVVGPAGATANALAAFNGTTGKIIKAYTLVAADIPALDAAKITTGQVPVARVVHPETLIISISDETTVITSGTNKVRFRMPYAMTVTEVRASLSTASTSGAPTFDINEGGTSILSTKITIDANEKTSKTAATLPVIGDTSLADDAEISVDIDSAGTGATGAKVYLIGTRA